LYLTNKRVFENFGAPLPGCPLVAGLNWMVLPLKVMRLTQPI